MQYLCILLLQVDVASRSQCRDVYSKIRSSKIDEDLYASQALQITEKDGKFQVSVMYH